MKKKFQFILKQAKKQKIVSYLCGSAFLVVLLGQLLIFFKLRLIQDSLVVHYTKEGIDHFGNLGQILGYGFVAWGIIVMNFLIALELEERDWLWGKVVAGITLGLSVLLFVAFWGIIAVN